MARQNAIRKIRTKRKFVNAIKRLKGMKKDAQLKAVLGASNEFIKDLSVYIRQLRRRPDLVKASHRKVLKKHGTKLRKLIHAKTPIHQKRLILMQSGGIFPFLIPVITAVLSAGGAIGAAATSAAILKN